MRRPLDCDGRTLLNGNAAHRLLWSQPVYMRFLLLLFTETSRKLTPALLLFTLVSTCGSAPEPDQPLPALGTAARPVVYDNFARIASLFRQNSDTTYLVNFWATWCKPCREEIGYLQQLAQEDHPKPLEIVLVSLDQETGAIERIPSLLTELAPDLSSIVLTDTSDATWGPTIDRVWSGSLPTTIIYRGQLRYVYRRAFNTYTDLDRAMEPMMK